MSFSPLDSALLGPLFATAAMRACFADHAWIGSMLAVEAALARSESRLGLAPDALGPAIAAIRPEDLDIAAIGERTGVAGVPTIPFVQAVQARLSTDLERSFHKGATTQDIIDTALVLRLRDAFHLISTDLDAILQGLSRLADRHRATPCVGRSYGQHAAPVSFGYKVAVWLSGIADAADRLPALRRRVLVASLGGPVGTLASLGADGPRVLDEFARELGLGVTPLCWHTNRGRIAEAGAWLVELMGALAKMATDVVHLASTEVGEVAEPHVPGRGGSSAMPHKRNPVGGTVILAAHAAAKGHASTLFEAMAAAHERPAGLWHAEWTALPSLLGLASGALREARTLAEGLVIDTERMRTNIDLTRGLLFADAAAGRLGARLGREAAHHLVEQAAGTVRQSGVTLADALSRTQAVRDAGVDLTAAFDLAPAVAAAARWVDPALQHAASAREHLAREFVTSKQREAALTQAGNQVLGTWKLRSYEREELATGKRHNQFGDHPDGYLGYAPDGRMYAMFIRQDRITPRDVVPTEEEGVQLIGSMVAYAGTYTLGERQVVHHIDISWNQNWTGTDQVRFFELDGDVLTITTAPYHSHQDGKEGRSILVWDRVPPR
jgi:3-carboxy-cis,cis-muconate cycloisomerase